MYAGEKVMNAGIFALKGFFVAKRMDYLMILIR